MKHPPWEGLGALFADTLPALTRAGSGLRAFGKGAKGSAHPCVCARHMVRVGARRCSSENLACRSLKTLCTLTKEPKAIAGAACGGKGVRVFSITPLPIWRWACA